MEKYICVHGHFYQPPRENPWLEAIELQDSAYPYHDWNERITAECYGQNASSRRLDGENRIVEIVNNYSRISFNLGPTLLSWMTGLSPLVYQRVIDADRLSQERFGGHGSAIAQVYNHMIMPLSNQQDKYTQVKWGIRDFESRFGRPPEGMWLPETAVDWETLDILSEHGIKFTVLAPHQASLVRKTGEKDWHDISGGRIDPTRAYRCHLPSGRDMALFFYDGPISRAVAFERLLNRGEDYAHRLLGAFSEERDWPQLVHIATDGETYGHHHRFGDMALAYALHYIESNGLAQLVNYGQYLEKHPPEYEVTIEENTSWSCAHGIERWRSDCGCNSGGRAGWNQAWREPLRNALDRLRDELASIFEEHASKYLRDPWAARNDYINVVLDRSPESIQNFLEQHSVRQLEPEEVTIALKLMELQRHAMLMYTSCGWFFDELSGIETVQVIQYAGRVVQLSQELFGDSIEERFVDNLAQAKSNIPEHQNGGWIYENFVKPTIVDLDKVTAHFAASSLFEDYSEQSEIYSYSTNLEDYQTFEAGRIKMVLGRARINHRIVQESREMSFGVLHFGDQNLNAGVREYRGEEAYVAMAQEMVEAFEQAAFSEVIRAMERHFEESNYSLRTLFRDEQRKVLSQVLESTLAGAEAVYRLQYDTNYALMRFLIKLGTPIPKALHSAAEFVLNADLRNALSQEEVDAERVRNLVDELRTFNVPLDDEGLALLFQQTIEQTMEKFAEEPTDINPLNQLVVKAEVARALPFQVDLWQTQNHYYEMLHEVYLDYRNRADAGDAEAQEWAGQFATLGELLSLRVE